MALLKPITPPRAQSARSAICREKCENMRAEYDYSKAQRAALLPSEGKTRIHTTPGHESPFIDPLTPTLVRNKAANRGGGACSLPCEAGEQPCFLSSDFGGPGRAGLEHGVHDGQ